MGGVRPPLVQLHTASEISNICNRIYPTSHNNTNNILVHNAQVSRAALRKLHMNTTSKWILRDTLLLGFNLDTGLP